MATFLRFLAVLLLPLTGTSAPATATVAAATTAPASPAADVTRPFATPAGTPAVVTPEAGTPGVVTRGGAEDGGGYRHLGAVTTGGGYAGVTGTVTVTDPGVRAGTNDFVAARFLAGGRAGGRDQWLEVGWTEDGWRDDAQYVYTFDTVDLAWRYYPRYPVRPGDRVTLALTAGTAGPHGTAWSAWLLRDGRWNLLTTHTLPIGDRATIEEYVEVYVDPTRGGTYPVPPVPVSGVEVRADPGGPYLPWVGAAVPTAESPAYDGYQVTWRSRHDSWTAGTVAR